MCVYIYIYKCTYMCLCLFICVYICVYIYIYIYICICIWPKYPFSRCRKKKCHDASRPPGASWPELHI